MSTYKVIEEIASSRYPAAEQPHSALFTSQRLPIPGGAGCDWSPYSSLEGHPQRADNISHLERLPNLRNTYIPNNVVNLHKNKHIKYCLRKRTGLLLFA